MSNVMAQLQLRDYFLLLLNVEANPNFTPEAGKPASSNMGINFKFFRKENESKFKIELDVIVNPKDEHFRKSEYRIHIKMESFLEFDSLFPEKEIPNLLVPNGLAMTYSIARGIVGQATGTSLHGKFLLPSVNFIELIKEKFNSEQRKKLRKRSNKLRN